MRVCDLIDEPGLGLILRTGEESLHRSIRSVYTTDLPDPGRYLTGGELVLTGLIWHHGPHDSETFVRAVAQAGAVALAAGDAAYGNIPHDLVAACERHGVLLLEVPVEVSFATVTERITRRLAEESGSGIAGVLSRRRRLLNALADGTGLSGLVRVWSRDNDIPAAVLSTSGRPVASTLDLDQSDRDGLARGFLVTERFPASITLSGRVMSVFPIGERGLSGWFLTCLGDHQTWPREAQETVLELVSLAGVERARTEEGLRARQPLGEHIITLVMSGMRDPVELAARLRAAGLDPEAEFVALIATAQGMSGPVDVPKAVLDEELRPDFPDLMIAALGGETVGLVPAGTCDVADLLRRATDRLEPAMGHRRLAIGVSGPAHGSGALRGAVDEARHVCRLAELRHTRLAVATADEVDSHVLLIASVPDDVRQSFRTRVLGPVLRYDEAHDSRLVDTLDAFLDSSGSWQHCAQRLHVHVNTLRYRMRRIEELTGRSLSTLEDRVDLFLALRIR